MIRANMKPAFHKQERMSQRYYRNQKSKLFRGNHVVKCMWCPKKLTFEKATVDHIVSLWRGGSNEPGNLTIACAECNAARNEFEMYMRDYQRARRLERKKEQTDDLRKTIRTLWKGIIRRRPHIYRLAQQFKPQQRLQAAS